MSLKQTKSPSPAGKGSFSKRLLAWYDRHKRDLPWRTNTDPYRVLVSELMLQQTQVATVIPYYRRFLKQFPTVKSLAQAPEARVMKAWEGLGYYRRARFLQAAAKAAAVGGFPRHLEGLLGLPGVGEYTAAAVGSIAFGLPEAVVDGNVIRVLTRHFALAGDPAKEPLKSRLRELAASLVRPQRPGDYNQALMELGALVCRPDAPDCARCPLLKSCQARGKGKELEFPQLAARPVTKKVFKSAALLVDGKRVLMAERTGSGRAGDEGRMGGLWQFPEVTLKKPAGFESAARRLAAKTAAGTVKSLGGLEPVVHQVTHHRIEVRGFVFEAQTREASWQWVALARLKALPLAKAERRLATQLLKRRL